MTQVYDILGAVERHFKNNEENTNAVVFGQLDEQTYLNKLYSHYHTLLLVTLLMMKTL